MHFNLLNYFNFQFNSYRTTVDDQNGDPLTFPVWSKTAHNFIATMGATEDYSSRSECFQFYTCVDPCVK